MAASTWTAVVPVAPHRPAVDVAVRRPGPGGAIFMAVINTFAHDAVDLAEPLTLDAAHARSCEAALAESEIGTVGLEIEAHLVDLRAVPDAVAWHRVEQAAGAVREAADASAVTFEPGGQLELSGRPEPDIVTAVAAMR